MPVNRKFLVTSLVTAAVLAGSLAAISCSGTSTGNLAATTPNTAAP